MRTHGNSVLIPHGLCYLFSANESGTPVAKIELLPAYSAVVLIEEHPEGTDPWDLPELQDTGIKWSGKWMSSIWQRSEKGPSLSIAFPFMHCLLYQGSEAEKLGGPFVQRVKSILCSKAQSIRKQSRHICVDADDVRL